MKLSTTLKFSVAFAVVSSVSACLGGTSNDDNGGATASNYLELSSDYETLTSGQEGMSNTSIASMPTSGSSTYVGVAEYSYNADQGGMLSDMSITTNFQNQKVSGRLDNFIDPREGNISGGLDIAGDIEGNTFDANAQGQLSQGNEVANLSLDLDGNFLGGNASQISGSGSGTMEIPNDGNMGLSVVFAAKEQ